MVKTKAEVKLKIGEWIEEQQEPFTTQDVKAAIQPLASNICLTPNRLTNYIRSTGKAEFDSTSKEWIPIEENPKVRIKPLKINSKD